jgi:lysyl-tRNA synthetase class 2
LCFSADSGQEGRAFPSLTRAERLRYRSTLVRRIRSFFTDLDYVEVETPLRVTSPGIDPYIDALPAGAGFFLATSPELGMKKLLASGLDRIFQITRAFRAGEKGDLHSSEFTILEWYCVNGDYRHLMELTEDLVRSCAASLEEGGVHTGISSCPDPFRRTAVDEAFVSHAGWKPSQSFVPDRFFRDLVDKVEPALAEERAVFLLDYPEQLGSMARTRPDDPNLCERFELYLEGVEICNGFTELTDPVEQRLRFSRDNQERKRLGKEAYPVDRRFLQVLEMGLPPCAGNALGVDRLLLALTGCRSLAQVSSLAEDDSILGMD